MRAAILIAMREVRERRAVLAAALVAALLPFASPLIPGVQAAQAADARGVMALILAVGLGAILSVVLGATAVARDLAENRLGFDFARPIGAFSIWAGRLGAAIALVLATMAIVLVPVLLMQDRIALPDHGALDWSDLLVVPTAVALLVGLAHAAGVAFRSRSRWLALDLVGIVVVVLVGASGVRRIYDAFAVSTALAVATVALLATVPALWIASALQVARGRTDIVAGHRALSVSLWSMLLVVALAIVGFSVWFVAADVDDLVQAWAEPAPYGSWIVIDGWARGRPGLVAQFLLDTETGRSIRRPPGDLRTGNATSFSRDGRRAVAVHQPSPAASVVEVEVIDLGAAEARGVPTSIAFPLQMPFRTDLSPSGTRLATLQGKSLSVHDLATGRILAAAKLDETDQTWGRVRLTFVDDRRVRVYALLERLVAYEFDVEARALTSWTGPAVADGSPEVLWQGGHERLVLTDQGPTGIVLLDGTTGETVRTLGPGDGVPSMRCAFLADGRIALIDGIGTERAALRLFSHDGEPLGSIELGATGTSERFALGAEAAPGELLIGRGSRDVPGEPRLMLVDLATGRIRDVAGEGRPVAAMPWIAQHRPALPGSVGARLVQRGHSVWLLDPESATMRLLAGLAPS